MTTDLARAQTMILDAAGQLGLAADLLFKLSAETGPKTVVHNNVKKLTKRDALVIRQMRRAGSTQQEIADSFDVNRATISRIVRGIYW